MKLMSMFLVLAVTILLVLQVRADLVRPKWEYKVQSLAAATACDAGMSIPEPDLAKQSLNDPRAREARDTWASSIMAACFNRLGNEGWELLQFDSQNILLKRLKRENDGSGGICPDFLGSTI